MSQKRERSTNFTREETDLLVKLIEENKNIIENKKSGAKTWNEKDRCWKEIEVSFNSMSGVYFRSAKTLKLKYEGMKRDVRKKSALILAETYSTEGGHSTAAELTVAEKKVKKMMSLSVDGMESIHDSDHMTEEVSIQPESITPSSQHSEDCLEIDDYLENENSCGENQPTPKMRKQSIEECCYSLNSGSVKNGNPKTKRPFEKLVESKLEIANLQKLILDGEYDNKRKQWIFDEKERAQQQKRWDFEEEEREHKREMWALEKKLILEKIEIKNFV